MPSRKIHLISGILAILCSFSLSLIIYLLFIQSPLLSKREFLAVVLLFLVLIFPIYLLIDRFFLPRFRSFSRRGKALLLLASGLFSLFILATTNHPPLFPALPKHSLSIQVPAASGENASERSVSISWITTSLGDVSYSQLVKEGDWVITDSGISYKGTQPSSLRWEGKTGEDLKIEFVRTAYSNPVLLGWDGRETPVNLIGPEGTALPVSHSFTCINFGTLLALIFLFVSSAFIFLVVTVFFLSQELKIKFYLPRRKYSWLLYTLPMIAVWGVTLMAFFPGMMSTDSNDQWGQILSGQLNNTHPVFHTLSMWLVTRIWFSPAAVVIAQILFLSLSVAWGIRLLEEHNLPPWAAWFLAAVFALAPLNANMVVVLWKDIPYSTSLFLFSLMILKIALTQGEWLEKRLSWVWLGLVGLCVASFRHNGLPIPFFTLPVLMLVFRKWWKPLLGGLALMSLMYVLIQGPFYKSLNIGQRQIGFVQEIMLHHIAAHIANGQPLSTADQALADSIFPRNGWDYSSCTALSLQFSPGYSKLESAVQGPAIQKLFLNLAFKEPAIEVEHLAGISSIVWRSPGFCGANTLVPINETKWIGGLGVRYYQENSLIPWLEKPFADFLIAVRDNPDLTLLIAPAVYLWLGIYATAILAIRKRDWRVLLYIFPIVIQSVILALINVSDNYRYYFATYLTGLLGIGLLILSLLPCDANFPDIQSENSIRKN
jgi:hypothetical protein